MKLEVAVNSWLNDVDGIKIADAFNAYLPANISIFGVVPVTKSFDARRSCYSRTYDYYFPAACIGINNESSSEDVDQRIQYFRRTLKSLEGRHAFHNYTVRRLYRKSQRRGTYSPSRNLIADEESSKDEEPSFKDTHDEQDNPAADIGEERGAGRRAYWLDESEEGKDPVKASHFRNVAKCTCEGPEKLNCPSSVVRIRVTGESFMVHQIRKMVGTAIAVFRHVLPEDAIPVSTCRHARVVLPLAPPHGLVLSGNSFFPFRGGYTRAKGGTGGYFFSKLGIQVSSQIAERMNSFWLEKLAPVISSSMNEEEAPWSQWLESLELNRIDDLEFANLRDAWKQWQSMATMRRYSDEH
ncbi:putative tRNA pseudouridine synthase isoform X2 [Selaginella moellendorffii]|uniref:putative tRNA pseudouridine synthase isoform X2 n=1 Tax=Selaginella moellendorffii TaxID=88036 RepID=UPI000D1CD495|nr:putative tRNA pseudouridine synthase isoform X2 [Selaginella moellendorffii]XP_024545129.1 putative tRNA pseudouridine synthase isoform X2 [Selaginella moellendorffii]XP_024545130.1 putative tRNA pseudouridine synthase isoform X2 [Selaginella moellendorffii]XP_024545131.1 putative tRNA pseudouridine synthase isoform X2 [Selaginella moellendorffii]|eukprot:XP_024545128.1 putative tRNA pseudouridine synthase isoform X2 [Selaginella moellendorffii]